MDYQYRKKSVLLKMMVVFVNIQRIIIDVCAQYGLINCVGPYISSMAMGAVIKSILCLIESLILGSVCYGLYIADSTHL